MATLAPEGSVPATQVKSTSSIASALNYPSGHLGYLSDFQQDALQKFKTVLEERGIWKRGPPASHNDPTLLRFLRARRWNIEGAYTQFKETEDWRAANQLDRMYETIDIDAYEKSRRMYPQWTGRRDRRGIPLYLFEIRVLDSKNVTTYEKSVNESDVSQAETDGKTPKTILRLFALYENLIRFSQPFSTQLVDRESPDVPVTMSTNIVDVSGVGLKQFWNLKNHMQAASEVATAHYPETLDRIFVIGAPFFFSTVWGWIKRWFDPITVSKIFILSAHEVKPVLESFIEPRNIPKKYGGELDFSFGQLAGPDPAWDGVVQWENGYTSFPTGPLLWEDVEGDERVACIALGSKEGKLRHETVCTVPKTWADPSQAAAAPEAAKVTVLETQTNGVTVNGTSETNHVVESEATQTAPEPTQETQDDSTQTDETVALEKLTITDDEKKAATEIPAVAAAPVA